MFMQARGNVLLQPVMGMLKAPLVLPVRQWNNKGRGILCVVGCAVLTVDMHDQEALRIVSHSSTMNLFGCV